MNCKHEHTQRVSSDIEDRIYCPDCDESWTESEWTDFREMIDAGIDPKTESINEPSY